MKAASKIPAPLVTQDRRSHVLRRQINDAFAGPDGRVALSKVLAVATQIAVLYHVGRTWDALIDKPESLAIALTLLIAPDFLKKLLAMKYGGAK